MKPRIYTIATAHLDTSWRWDFETTVREYLPATLYDNFNLMEKYPDYKFSFEGSYRYELMEEYYPEGFKRLKELVKEGRWFPAGSAYEAGDVNVPSPEALFRNFLYGNEYFEKKLGARSKDVYLPDCFGFGLALPSVAAHSNLLGFTTQKLTWGCAYGVPFSLGKWRGLDGGSVYACLDGESYNQTLLRVRRKRSLARSLRFNARKYGVPFVCVLHGIGDRGGAPREPSAATVCRELKLNPKKKIDVLCESSDRIFRDMDAELSKEQKENLPVWENELLMTDHGVGGYTSRSIGKRWNRKCEELADAAERINVAAHILGVKTYPKDVFDKAWKRVIAHQFHDDLPGTSLEVCYKRNWNDYVLSLNEFSSELSSAAAEIIKLADSSFVKGTAAAAYNPLAFERRKNFVFRLTLPGEGDYARAYDASGVEILSQTLKRDGDIFTVELNDVLPPCGIKIYDVVRSGEACPVKSSLRLGDSELENQKYLVKIDGNGDISSIYDKEEKREALASPIRTALFDYDGSVTWPAWELVYEETKRAPREYAAEPVVSVKENGGARISLEIKRTAGGSTFVQTVFLEEGGDYVGIENEIEWRSLRTLLKTEFPLSVSREKASFDLGLGFIERDVSRKSLYEFPAQKWADITSRDASFGVSVLSDSKYGWDMPNARTLRLTGIHTPRYRWRGASHLMDFGLNRYSYAVRSHSGNVGSETQKSAAAFNQPAFAFAADKHKGWLGSEFSFCSIGDEALLRAVKLAQNGDETVVRVNEANGKNVEKTTLNFKGLVGAREIFASEEPRERNDFSVSEGKLEFSLKPFEVRSFALDVKSETRGEKAKIIPIELPFNATAATRNSDFSGGELPCKLSIPLEQYPEEIVCAGVSFKTGRGKLNALKCRGQKINVPAAESLFIVAASVAGDRRADFIVGNKKISLSIADFQERIGKWDLYSEGETANIKKDVLAWNSTHAHGARGDVYAKQLYFFMYKLDLDGAETAVLPDDPDVVILAASAADGLGKAVPAAEFYDSATSRRLDFSLTEKEKAEAARRKGCVGRRAKFLAGFVKRYIVKELRRFGQKRNK